MEVLKSGMCRQDETENGRSTLKPQKSRQCPPQLTSWRHRDYNSGLEQGQMNGLTARTPEQDFGDYVYITMGIGFLLEELFETRTPDSYHVRVLHSPSDIIKTYLPQYINETDIFNISASEYLQYLFLLREFSRFLFCFYLYLYTAFFL